jgi:hypothetical protein
MRRRAGTQTRVKAEEKAVRQRQAAEEQAARQREDELGFIASAKAAAAARKA